MAFRIVQDDMTNISSSDTSTITELSSNSEGSGSEKISEDTDEEMGHTVDP